LLASSEAYDQPLFWSSAAAIETCLPGNVHKLAMRLLLPVIRTNQIY